jgi:hypothetical protein
VQKTFKLCDILPNPFRDIERHPVYKEKVEALVASINRTRWWGNVIARDAPGRRGKVELAYGHHRLDALRTTRGEDGQAEVIYIPDLSDAEMLRMMADDNDDTYGTNAAIEAATVWSVVTAYADGKIELPPVRRIDKNTHYAPKFRPGGISGATCTTNFPYTADSVAEFLGWGWKEKDGRFKANRRVLNALALLEAEEEKLLTKEDAEGLSSEQAKTMAKNARKIAQMVELEGGPTDDPDEEEERKRRGEREARKAARTTAEKLRNKDIGVRDVEEEMGRSATDVDKRTVYTATQFAKKVYRELENKFTEKDKWFWGRMGMLKAVRDDIDPQTLQALIDVLLDVAGRCRDFAADLGAPRKRLQALGAKGGVA